ncbi:MAG: neutral zinc metallopeptidase [Pseudomonadota bacterium]|nr:neutral zinc metallopeptidase [Pseudomonadota bacterium]
MRMDDQQGSDNVEDVRGAGGFRPIHGIGIGSIAIALIGGWLFGVNPLQILGLMSDGGSSVSQRAADQPAHPPPADDAQAHFVSQILRSTETVWTAAFKERGAVYKVPKLRLFRDSYPTACGEGQAAAGPFYCADDQTVYLDLGFFDVMTQQLGAPGQFAHAYVIGHEVGHHVQDELGLLGKANRNHDGDRHTANEMSVRVELQADCFAGVWASRAQQEHGWRLEPGDIDSALNAASRIGDDTLQRQSRGTVVPETFTHGTSAQRVAWFKRGVSSGQIDACDTFGAKTL